MTTRHIPLSDEQKREVNKACDAANEVIPYPEVELKSRSQMKRVHASDPNALIEEIERLKEIAKGLLDYICIHPNLGRPIVGRDWCCDCHEWVYQRDLDFVKRALEYFEHGGKVGGMSNYAAFKKKRSETYLRAKSMYELRKQIDGLSYRNMAAIYGVSHELVRVSINWYHARFAKEETPWWITERARARCHEFV